MRLSNQRSDHEFFKEKHILNACVNPPLTIKLHKAKYLKVILVNSLQSEFLNFLWLIPLDDFFFL